MSNPRTKYLLWSLALAWIIACAPLISSVPAVPTLDPGGVDRIIAQTAGAASTQTARANPTITSSATSTPTPRGSDTPEPTVTNTLVFFFHTPTIFVPPTGTATFSPTSDKDFACAVLDAPPDGTIYNPRVEFKVRWRLRNVGRQAWDGINVDFVYDFGDRFHKTASYDLPKTIEIGDVAEIFVDMEAPKDPGTYTTHWALKINTFKFCKVSLTIGVTE